MVLTPDPSLKPAEVFFETSQGILDASVETQLREIERGLIDKLERRMSLATSAIGNLVPQVAGIEVLPWIGEVTDMTGLLIAPRGPVVSIGDFVEVLTSSGRSVRSQVIGFRDERVLSMPLEEMTACSQAIG